MKFFSGLALIGLSLEGVVANTATTTVNDKCLICNHVGFASTEANALLALTTDVGEYCAVIAKTTLGSGAAEITNAAATVSLYDNKGGATSKGLYTSSEDAYCVAQFFIYHAEDINKWIYGVKRYGSSSSVSAGLVDVSNYDGVKGFQYSIQRTVGDVVFGRKYDLDATTFGANPIFKERGKYYGTCSLTTLEAAADDTCGTDSTPTGFSGHAGEAVYTDKGDATCHGSTFFFNVCGTDRKVICVAKQTITNPDICTVKDADVTGGLKVDDVDRTVAISQQLFMTDGREDGTQTSLSITTAQTQKHTRCLVCHGSQEFFIPPAQSSLITMPCWNPSGNTVFNTDADALMDPRQYCQPPTEAPYCTTSTWQYSTQDSAGARTSHWVGISRGCASTTTKATTKTVAVTATGNNRAASSLKEYIRLYAPTNTAAKAKDLAKYPTLDTALNVPVSNVLLSTMVFTGGYNGATAATIFISPLEPQFMSADGSGSPDLPTTVVSSELECISCVTPIGNTDATNACVTAKSTGRVKCKTLSCNSVTATYKLSATASDTHYYAKRGCTVDPDDGKIMGEQDPADDAVVPAGYTALKQNNQRSTTALGNTGRSSSVHTAQIFDCYSCKSKFSSTVQGSDAVEPKYDDIKEIDTSLCWETYEPQADTSVTYTGTSGSCEGKCYASAYKYKEVGKTATTFNWYIKRGCDKTGLFKSRTVPVSNLYGVQQTDYGCNFQNGTLCNGQMANYDTSLEVKAQSVRLLQCYTCETGSENTDSANTCFTVPSTTKAQECADLSYTSCTASEATYESGGTTYYYMKRGCSKDAVGVTTNIASFDDIAATGVAGTTTICGSSSCNKNNGQVATVAKASAAASEDAAADDSSTGDETAKDTVEDTPAVDAESSSVVGFAFATTLYAFLLI